MEKLTIEHLAPYLPYGLRLFHRKVTYPKHTGDVVLTPTVLCHVEFYLNEHVKSFYKSYLRPLSQLTQEIEHNGEKFVPIVELYKIACGNYKDAVVKYVDILSTTEIRHAMKGFSDFYFGMYQSENDVRLGTQHHFKLWSTDLEGRHTIMHTIFCQSLLFQKLYQWHFDVHGLIDKGLALSL